MAIYNEILSARFPKLAQRLFSMKGEQAVKQLSGEVMLTQNLPFGVEHRFLMSENRFAVSASLVGAAGQFVAFRFRNPTGSGVVAIFEKISLQVGTAQNVAVDLSSVNALGDLGSIQSSQRLDGRLGAAQSSLTNTFTSTKTIALGASIYFFQVGANAAPLDMVLTDDQELTVLPGDALGIGNTTAATVLTIAVWWRERPLEESEAR